MYTIELLDEGTTKTRDLVREVTSLSKDGMNLTQMRNRIRILDALDASTGNSFDLEDADFAELKGIVEGMTSWVRADRGLLKVIDGIIDAPKVRPEPKSKTDGAAD